MAVLSVSRVASGIVACVLPAVCAAQDLTPRAYFPAPVSSNAVIVTYLFSDGEVLFDPTLPITDATGRIHAPVMSYYHAFNFFGRSANITGSLPFAIGDLRGSVAGRETAIHRAGMGDTVLRLAVNLRGAPARSPREFVKAGLPKSMIGASLKIVAPLGQYDPTRLINLGTNRWAFKPELGVTRRAGKFVLDVYGGVWFFTANDDFFAPEPGVPGKTRRQDPIGAMEAHLSYDIKPFLWLAVDFTYWYGGRTSVDGLESETTLQANSRLGLTGSVPLTRSQSLKFSYSDGVIIRVGGNFRIFSVGWQYGWLGTPFRGN
jgi:hypothetical protein